jgi:hypothetical protein
MMDGRMFESNRVKAIYVTDVDYSRAKMGEWMQAGGMAALPLPPPMDLGMPLPGPPPMGA